jgi:hypothetical protein
MPAAIASILITGKVLDRDFYTPEGYVGAVNSSIYDAHRDSPAN